MKNKLVTLFSVSLISLASCLTYASHPACSGTPTSACSFLSTSNCSGYYIPPKDSASCNGGDSYDCGIYCTVSGSTCVDGGEFCS